jgi:predicted AlkP superfamily pyrophosphatase or phosphodiesterase
LNEKILLILADGMRPDIMMNCGNPFVREFLKDSVFTMEGRTVMPSVTLPCHMSLFHSVPSERHGILTNDWHPQVRPVNGICEVLKAAGKKCGLLYDWEPLRDLTRPGSIRYGHFTATSSNYEDTMPVTTEAAVKRVNENVMDFLFIYYGLPDGLGHKYGFTTEEYRAGVGEIWENIKRITGACKAKDEYNIIVTADHGGHERGHGLDIPEDMIIPIIYRGRAFRDLDPSKVKGSGIMDIAPTLAHAMGIRPDPEWEGSVLF